jgi:acetyl-CoA acetyltransferase
MPPDALRGAVAVAGVAESRLGEVGPGVTPLDLVAEATAGALDDAGLRMDDVDGLFTASAYYGLPGVNTGEALGIRPGYSDSTNLGGASFVSHLLHAAAAIHAGACEVGLIVYGSTQRSDGGRLRSVVEPDPYEAPYHPRYPVSMFALAAARHMHELGTTREQLAEVAVAARAWARLTPGAFARDPLTIGDVLASRMVSSPLTVRDCCLVTDGGGAVIVTSTERARALRRPLAVLLGAGEAHWHRTIACMPDLTTTAATDSGARAYAMAGLAPADVDVVQLYDAFTINPILFLEDLGFCAKGDGGPFVAGGAIAPGGRLPVNTNGGGLSYTHPGMLGIFLVVEAVRQLRGEAGERQQPGVDVALVHGNGGALSAQATALLGTLATL